MKTKKHLSLVLSAVILCMFLLSFPAIPAECATSRGITTLKPNVAYTSYDFTGDGKKDRFKYKQSGKNDGYYKNIEITVNGKVAFRLTDRYGFYRSTVKLLTLSNGKKFLFVNTQGDNGDGRVKAVLQYKNGKYTKAVDFLSLLRNHGTHNDVAVSSVKGSSVVFKVYLMSFATGTTDYTMQFDYKSGTLKQNIYAAKVAAIYTMGGNPTRTMYVNKTINAYTNMNASQRAFVLHRGDKVTIDQCRIASSRMLLRVRRGSRYGWIIAADKYPIYTEPQFQNVNYAG